MAAPGVSRIAGMTLLAACVSVCCAQGAPTATHKADVTAHLTSVEQTRAHATPKTKARPPAVIWLKPVQASAAAVAPPGTFTLLQKNKMFLPHLLVVPVGSSVAFPNADPFFHNVFSLFDGRRFDLGLYEAGSTRSVVFSREGISYIFCNIHSEMSAVVISLTTPFYGVADAQGSFHLKDVPEGEYELHVWFEGQRQSSLERLTRRVHVSGEAVDLGTIRAEPTEKEHHLNKFGRPYEPDAHPIY